MTVVDTYLLLRALCDELARCGMRVACTSPGSRNTPIALSLAREPRIRCYSHIDERAAGFFALGAAKASGRPVAVTCTSGTAAANLLPAAIEAREARVPLILLTADRPPELREVGAGQTIDQIKLYGSAVKWFFELDLPDASPQRLRFVRALACRMYFAARDGRAGPVHLNVPLREPLVLEQPLALEEPGGGGRPGGAPWVSTRRPCAVPPPPPALPRRRPSPAVLVAGGLGAGSDPALGRALAELAARARMPLLADPLSGARCGSAAIAHYDLILRDPAAAAALAPAVVYRVGELPTSKPLRAWLAALEAPQVAFAADDAWSDPDSRLAERTLAPPPALLQALCAERPAPDESGLLERWRAADAAVAGAIGAELGDSGLSEPRVAALLGAALPAEATLVVASSMPVRDVETFFPVRDDPPRAISNRGANGIDGTVSSAFGAAAVWPGPVVLLCGDVALAHDLGGLLAARRLGLAITIVALNNDGGGIFHFLPVAREGEDFERHIATPHGLDFAHAAALYGCAYERPADPAALRAALARALAQRRQTTIIEVRTERAANRELHAALERRALAALHAALEAAGSSGQPRAPARGRAGRRRG